MRFDALIYDNLRIVVSWSNVRNVRKIQNKKPPEMIINLKGLQWQQFKLLSHDTQWSNLRAANAANLEVMNEKKSPTPAGIIPSRSKGLSLCLCEKENILGEISIYEARLLLVVNLALKGVGIKFPGHNMWLTRGMPSHCLIVCWWVS